MILKKVTVITSPVLHAASDRKGDCKDIGIQLACLRHQLDDAQSDACQNEGVG